MRERHDHLLFRRDIEDQFQIDTCAPRWRQLQICLLIGLASLWAGVTNDGLIFPLLGRQLVGIWAAVTMGLIGCALLTLLIPRQRARAWHMDLVASTAPLAIAAVLLWAANAEAHLPALMHSANVVLLVMWTCLLARIRFWFALLDCLAIVAGYVLMLHPRGPLEQQVLWNNSKILAFATTFALVANYVLEHRERRAYLLNKLKEAQSHALAQARDELQRLSVRDPLTGLYNRRHFDQALTQAWAEANASARPLGLLLLDVDFFKLYNDSYGHPRGDLCLQKIAALLDDLAVQHGGTAARLGGEEFALLLPEHDLQASTLIGNTLRLAVRAAAIEHRTSPVADRVTISLGACACLHLDVSPEPLPAPAQRRAPPALPGVHPSQALMAQADAALYEAKQSGRDRVCARELLPAPGASATSNERPASAGASPEVEPAAEEPQLTRLTQALRQDTRRLRFAPELEAEFEAGRAAARRTRLAVAIFVGLVFFNGFVLSSRDMIADVADWFHGIQALVSVFALMLAALLLAPMRPWKREALHTLAVCCVVGASLWALSRSHTPLLHPIYLAIFLIPMFATAGSMLPLRWAAVPATGCLLGFLLTVQTGNPIERIMTRDLTIMALTATAFVLITSFQMEYGERATFLLRRLADSQHQALSQALEAVRRMAMRDPLTDLYNRRHFEAAFENAFESVFDPACANAATQPAAASPATLSLLLIDLDHFKLYNDSYGHLAGDICLKQVADILARIAQDEHALAARLGGEEFALLLPQHDADDALALGRQICRSIRDAGLPHRASQVAPYVSVSVGVATLSALPCATPRRLLSLADKALYRAKAGGRNRAVSLNAAEILATPVTAPMPLMDLPPSAGLTHLAERLRDQPDLVHPHP